MRTSSCKAKGRRCAVETKELLELYAPDLRPGDIEVTSSGACGEDVKLSPAARALYPFAIECKNVELLNIWKALAQAETHAHGSGYISGVDREARTVSVASLTPVLFFRRNRSKLYVALGADEFLKLVR